MITFEIQFWCDFYTMNNQTISVSEDAGRIGGVDDARSEQFLDRAQILRSIHEAGRSGRSVESVMRDRMAVVRGGANSGEASAPSPSMEYGRSVYKKRRCGKVASFFRCFLR